MAKKDKDEDSLASEMLNASNSENRKESLKIAKRMGKKTRRDKAERDNEK